VRQELAFGESARVAEVGAEKQKLLFFREVDIRVLPEESVESARARFRRTDKEEVGIGESAHEAIDGAEFVTLARAS
jgi:hypothetical protein